jgi:hypothetical protein
MSVRLLQGTGLFRDIQKSKHRFTIHNDRFLCTLLKAKSEDAACESGTGLAANKLLCSFARHLYAILQYQQITLNTFNSPDIQLKGYVFNIMA